MSEDSESAAALTSLAQQAAAMGDTVTVLFVPNFEAAANPHWERWLHSVRAHFLEQFLVNIEVLSEWPSLAPGLGHQQYRSLAVYFYLKEHSFDVAYFSLSGGLGHYTTLAKSLGLFPASPRLHTIAIEPTIWRATADRSFLGSREEIAIAYMEREATCASDAVIFASRAMLAWARKEGWLLPDDTRVLAAPPFMADAGGAADCRPGPRPPTVTELVFVGNAQLHGGMTLFCDALDRLAQRWSAPLRITFLGSFGRVLGEHSAGMVLRRARKWPFQLQFLPYHKFDAALSYLAQPGKLAVFPFVDADAPMAVTACLERQIPFVATNVGGIPDLVDPDMGEDCLCVPKAAAIADLLERTLRNGAVVSSSDAYLERRQRWADHFAEIRPQPARKAVAPARKSARNKQPLVSVVMAHHDRPHFLVNAIRSIRNQTYPNIELVLVDDGSELPQSRTLLDQLEPEFARRGWQIIRQPNRYLGAARNAGIRASKGELVLFVDDDNELFSNAVATLVGAMQASGADICTCLHLTMYGRDAPGDPANHIIHWVPLGGSLDLAFFEDIYGDANAMFRRDVFDRIGYLIEDVGLSGSDWELFTRAGLSGLDIKLVPEPLYWYRSAETGMFNTTHWYVDRRAIFELYKRFGFRNVEHIYHLLITQNLESFHRERRHFQLQRHARDERYVRLRDMDPSSEKALMYLAECASAEGRPETALSLLAQCSEQSDLKARLIQDPAGREKRQAAYLADASHLVSELTLEREFLRNAVLASAPEMPDPPKAYLEGQDGLCIGAGMGATTVASLVGVCPPGAVGFRATVRIEQELAEPAEVMVMLAPAGRDPAQVLQRVDDPGVGSASSGWITLTSAYAQHSLDLTLPSPSTERLSVILAVRTAKKRPRRNALVRFFTMSVAYVVNPARTMHPRLEAPATQRPDLVLTSEQLQSVRLVTEYESPYLLLAFLPGEEGIFMRPSSEGPVAAVMEAIVPPFCRRVVASVEIAEELASPFEFGIALAKAGSAVDWSSGKPRNVRAFSGWLKVKRKFELHKLVVETRELTSLAQDLHIAMRLPARSLPLPSQCFWRKFVLVWDD